MVGHALLFVFEGQGEACQAFLAPLPDQYCVTQVKNKRWLFKSDFHVPKE